MEYPQLAQIAGFVGAGGVGMAGSMLRRSVGARLEDRSPTQPPAGFLDKLQVVLRRGTIGAAFSARFSCPCHVPLTVASTRSALWSDGSQARAKEQEGDECREEDGQDGGEFLAACGLFWRFGEDECGGLWLVLTTMMGGLMQPAKKIVGSKVCIGPAERVQ